MLCGSKFEPSPSDVDLHVFKKIMFCIHKSLHMVCRREHLNTTNKNLQCEKRGNEAPTNQCSTAL